LMEFLIIIQSFAKNNWRWWCIWICCTHIVHLYLWFNVSTCYEPKLTFTSAHLRWFLSWPQLFFDSIWAEGEWQPRHSKDNSQRPNLHQIFIIGTAAVSSRRQSYLNKKPVRKVLNSG
jgi:hypothetical protein